MGQGEGVHQSAWYLRSIWFVSWLLCWPREESYIEYHLAGDPTCDSVAKSDWKCEERFAHKGFVVVICDSWQMHIRVDGTSLLLGMKDIVQCFFCGGCMENWKEGDDPLEDHAKYFPKWVEWMFSVCEFGCTFNNSPRPPVLFSKSSPTSWIHVM